MSQIQPQQLFSKIAFFSRAKHQVHLARKTRIFLGKISDSELPERRGLENPSNFFPKAPTTFFAMLKRKNVHGEVLERSLNQRHSPLRKGTSSNLEASSQNWWVAIEGKPEILAMRRANNATEEVETLLDQRKTIVNSKTFVSQNSRTEQYKQDCPKIFVS